MDLKNARCSSSRPITGSDRRIGLLKRVKVSFYDGFLSVQIESVREDDDSLK